MNSVRRSWIAGTVSCSIVLVLWILSRSMELPLSAEIVAEHRFSPALWAKLGEKDWNAHLRQALLDDLIGNHLPLGITALDVHRLLGDPEWRDEGVGQVWHYRVDDWPHQEFATVANLELCFDPSGVLESVSVQH